MSQVPQPRPWSRLASMARGRAVPPPPAEEPEQVQPRPTLPRLGIRPFGMSQASGYASSNVGSVPSSPTRGIGGTASVPSSPTVRPIGGISSTMTSPVRPAATVTTSSVPTSPVSTKAPSPTPKPAPTATKVPSPTPTSTDAITNALRGAGLINARSPRALKPEVQTPPQSPKLKSNAPPPSPLTLPPSQLKSKGEPKPEPEPEPKIVEQKNVLVQKTFDTRHNGGIDTGSNLTHIFKPSTANLNKQEHFKSTEPKEKIHHQKKSIPSSDESGTRIITLAGENKGAFMEIIQPPRNHRVFKGNSNFLTKNKDKQNSSSSDEERSNKKKDKSQKGKSKLSPPISAFTNNNVQGVNNSILFYSSCSNHDPGVQLAVTRKPGNGGFFQVKELNDGNYHT